MLILTEEVAQWKIRNWQGPKDASGIAMNAKPLANIVKYIGAALIYALNVGHHSKILKNNQLQHKKVMK